MALILEGNIDEKTGIPCPVIGVYNAEDKNHQRVEYHYAFWASVDAYRNGLSKATDFIPVSYDKVIDGIDNQDYLNFYARRTEIPETIEKDGQTIPNPELKNLMISLAYRDIKAKLFPTAVDDIQS